MVGEQTVVRAVSELMKEFVTRRHHAVTIAQRIAVGALVVDARIIEATAEAATWYGASAPQQLIGRWISLLHHPADAKLGRDLSAARHYGIHVPTRYVSRICQVETPGRYRPVLKDTTQIMLGEETYWVTVLSEPTEPPLALQLSISKHLQLPQAKEATQFYGQMSVAEMEALLHGQPSASGERSQISHGIVSQKSRNATPPRDGHAEQRDLPSLQPGQTFLMPTGRYIHWCVVCENLWRSDDAQPVYCGHRTCHSAYWRTGKSTAPEEL
jgi:hypothetical protein